MAARNLGSLTIDLVLRTIGLTQGADKAERELDKRTKAMQVRAVAFGTVIGNVLSRGLEAGFRGLVNASTAAIDFADSIRDASIRIGASTETLSAYAYAAKQTGTDIDELNKGLLRLSKNATAALDPGSKQAGLFDALGVSKESLRDIELLVPQVANAFSQLEDGATKAALAQELFGRSGANMIEFLNSGSAGLDEFARKAEELGIIIDQDTANAADEFNDTLANLRGAVQGLGVQIAADLLPALTDAARGLIELVREGDLARNVVSVLDAALSAGVGAIEAYNTAVRVTSAAMTTFVEAGQGYSQAVRNIWAPFSDGTVSGGIAQMKQAFADFDKLAAKPAAGLFANVVSSASGQPRANDPGLNGRLNALLADRSPSKGGGGSKKAGKSDAEREAEQLERAYESLNERLTESIALFGKTGEAAKLRYELENGELSKLTQAQKDGLIVQAEQLDQMALMAELQEAANDLVKEEQERVEQGMEDAKQILADLEFENELLGLNNEQRALAIQLRGLESEAVAEYGDAIAEANAKVEESLRQTEALDEARGEFKSFFKDVLQGNESIYDSFKDMLQGISDMIAERLAEQWVEQLFGASGTTGAGTSGGDFWASIFGSLFSGGKAGGGRAMPNSLYEVNERGFEMATVNGRDYMMTGTRPVEITPNHKLPGGQQIINMTVQGQIDRRTESQIGMEIGIKTRMAGRNS